jgi:hypothetical protein
MQNPFRPMPIYQDRGRWTEGVTYVPENFQHDHNVYYNCNTDPAVNDVDVTTEPNSIFADPMMVNPMWVDRGTDTYASIVVDFLLQGTSPAIEAGLDLSSGAPYYVPEDILGTSRPVGSFFDIGIHEYVAAGDFDHDGDVDLDDYTYMAPLINGPNQPPTDPATDLDGDNDCDMGDYSIYAAGFTG